jgi:AcrR family transcriptional regulator
MSELRQRKFARTRLALAGALSKALMQQTLSEVSVKALCREAEVSEATFFNYFPSKQALMAYLAQLWMLELGWHAQAAAEDSQGLAAIHQLFAHHARTCASRPGLMQELIVWLARGGRLNTSIELGAFERSIAFPKLAGIETTPLKGLDAWIVPQLEVAMKTGELPENTLIPTLLSLLLGMVFGVPLILLSSKPGKIADMYQQQLQLVWSGTRAMAKGRQPAPS